MIPTSHNYAPAKQFTPSPLNSQPDEYAKAARLWKEGDAKRFEAAEEFAGVVGNFDEGKTKALAARAFVSITTVQNYAKVGKLWLEMVRVYPSDAEMLRDEIETGFWLPVGNLCRGWITRK